MRIEFGEKKLTCKPMFDLTTKNTSINYKSRIERSIVKVISTNLYWIHWAGIRPDSRSDIPPPSDSV